MSETELNQKLKELNLEDFIWVIYIGIIFMSWYANSLERKYYTKNDPISKDKYRNVMIIIFSILIIVYLYFLKDSWDGLKSINSNTSSEKKNLLCLSFVASLFIAVSGAIFLYIAIKDKNLDVELAFN